MKLKPCPYQLPQMVDECETKSIDVCFAVIVPRLHFWGDVSSGPAVGLPALWIPEPGQSKVGQLPGVVFGV